MFFVFVTCLAHSFRNQHSLTRGFLLMLESKGVIQRGRFPKWLRTCSLCWSQDLGFFIYFVLLWSFTKTFLGPPPVFCLVGWGWSVNTQVPKFLFSPFFDEYPSAVYLLYLPLMCHIGFMRFFIFWVQTFRTHFIFQSGCTILCLEF